ncbi:DNA/RNA polymerase [Gonapodya prolifera JEL478]|uniref:DNA polymerase n=1 Tax=Gonapodya prolifera (strain JEL478) TaxID=1344416 RepID=A0A139B051_GONPJ|nr:DNA/RNA polymerase [Gonapodya prolifera JEL478]|eukprot:KXS22183.1 DNA/RNA polymerase [Gonapodya prolifera JEL478]
MKSRGLSKWWTPGHGPPPHREIESWVLCNPIGRKDVSFEAEDKTDVDIANVRIETRADESNSRGIIESQILKRNVKNVSQLEAPTPKNPYGFKFDAEKSNSSVTHERQHYTLLSVEILAGCSKDMLPDPARDPVKAVVYCFYNDGPSLPTSNTSTNGFHIGILKIDDGMDIIRTGLTGYLVEIVADERTLFEAMIRKVQEIDPDMVAGYEIHNASWGYLVERGHAIAIFKLHYVLQGFDVLDGISRTTLHSNTKSSRDDDQWGFSHSSSVHITGRIVLNVWRLMRGELNLTSYTLENLVFHILHRRIPFFKVSTLASWYESSPMMQWRSVRYLVKRVQSTVELLLETDIIDRTSEFARVFGIQFFSVLDRGSQFKVESVMARIAKPQNLIMFTPTKTQVSGQRAAECLPLIMEPESQFFSSPLLVLDFQSLYPSVMIAYNYCYSTCLGRIQNLGSNHRFGASDFEIPISVATALKDQLHVSPNGLAFVKSSVREGVLGKMLSEILDTRVMVKNSMKIHKEDKALLRLLDARQLSLKYLANVTYGYTSASFSGRMPCIDIADAIVQTGRETLEKAIKLIHSTADWGARVVYGDTDSLFVYLEGASRERAWKVGKEIVDTVTNGNPYPMKLKFEKVYHPCVLQTKKRYVGWMFETEDQKEAVFDAKGIETVRRDGCPAVGKILEQSLRILFRTQDISLVKSFVVRQFSKIVAGKVSLQDFIIAKEIRLGTYSDKVIPPPGVIVAKKKMELDKRAEPQYGERVPFVVVNGGPDSRLYENVVAPEDAIKSRSLRLNAQYYITKQIIPALSRTFSLMGVDVLSWFSEMPKSDRAIRYSLTQAAASQSVTTQGAPSDRNGRVARRKSRGPITIEKFYATKHCIVCQELSSQDLCPSCLESPQQSIIALMSEARRSERNYANLLRVCRSCTGHVTPLEEDPGCESLDCQIFYTRAIARNKARYVQKMIKLAVDF